MKTRFPRLALCSTMAIALSACSEDTPTENPTVEEAATQAEKLERPEPGQYQQTVQITQLNMPGAPEEMAAQVRGAIEQNAQRTYCLTEEQANEGFAEQFRRVTENENCSWNRFAVDGGTVDAMLSCSGGGQGGGEVTIAMNGDVTATGSRIDMQMEQSGGGIEMEMAMTMRSQRLGDCPA